MDYDVYVNGKKSNLNIKDIELTDRQGSQADSIRLLILNEADTEIDRGSTIECVFGGFKSGKMNIDSISSATRVSRIGAVSSPIDAKKKKTRHWSKVRLFDIVNDVAVYCGLSVFYQGVENHYYENVTQYRETDLAFLNRLCTREGYALKVDDNRLVIYNKSLVEAQKTALKITPDVVLSDRISFAENPNAVRSVTVKYFNGDRLISYTATDGVFGEDKDICEYLATDVEAERFAKAYLRAFAENDITVDVFISIDDGVSAGSCVEFSGFARYDGRYFITECYHDPEKEQTRLCGRKIK